MRGIEDLKECGYQITNANIHYCHCKFGSLPFCYAYTVDGVWAMIVK